MIHQPSVATIELVDALETTGLALAAILLIAAGLILAWREIHDKHGDS